MVCSNSDGAPLGVAISPFRNSRKIEADLSVVDLNRGDSQAARGGNRLELRSHPGRPTYQNFECTESTRTRCDL